MNKHFVSVHVRNKNQFVFSAYSHTKLVNVLTHARSVFPSIPLYGAIGFHLSGSAVIPETVADLDLRLEAAGAGSLHRLEGG
jgi:7,8-dihydropterin-6-yl-methyl-4-(beta-D-ribofuranosyl)aminobenzene 5'-phosphate synthase